MMWNAKIVQYRAQTGMATSAHIFRKQWAQDWICSGCGSYLSPVFNYLLITVLPPVVNKITDKRSLAADQSGE